LPRSKWWRTLNDAGIETENADLHRQLDQ